MHNLKLIAFDAEDLAVVSAHLQDAVIKVGDMAYLPAEKRFAALLNRFDWTAADGAATAGSDKGPKSGESGKSKARAKPRLERRRAALRFERVLGARVSGIDLKRKGDVLALLALQFEPKSPDDPSGAVILTFAGNSAIRLEVECLEAELKDLGAAWRARGRPRHPVDEPG